MSNFVLMARSRYIDDSTVCGISQEQDFMLLLLGPSRLSLSRAVPFDSCNRCQSQQQDPKPTSRLSFTSKLEYQSWLLPLQDQEIKI